MGIGSYLTNSKIFNLNDSNECCFTSVMENIITEYTNMQGTVVYGIQWKILYQIYFRSYVGLLLLAGVYKSKHESLISLWNDLNGRPIFKATMSLQGFQDITRVIRFDDRSTRNERRERDKLAPIRCLWNKWESNSHRLFHPCKNVTIDEQLVSFHVYDWIV